MDRHPLRPSTPVARHVLGARRIPEPLGRGGLPDLGGDVRAPPSAAGFEPGAIAAPGEGLGG